MNQRRGFTLVEVAVAIAVVAILAAIIIPMLLKNLRDARRARARNDLQVIAGAIANQLKDLGSRRPSAPVFNPAGGLVLATGAGNTMWASGGVFPATPGGLGVPDGARRGYGTGHRSFRTLFNALDPAQGNVLFGLPAAGAGAELQYRGPYMTLAMANSSDPWGHSYVILGYNRFGMDGHRPIWVVCAGEAGTIAGENLRGGPGVPGLLGAPPAAWSYAGASATNIVIEIK